jgi:hypothetical protein
MAFSGPRHGHARTISLRPIAGLDRAAFTAGGSILLLVIDGLGCRYLHDMLPSGT